MTIATDVYGLGAILYALLAGKAPFGGDSVIETLEQVKLRAPEPPSGADRVVPRDLQTICLKCLEKDPGRRYSSAEGLAGDLERYLRGEPITARRVGRVERAWLWAKRRPAVAALTAATVLAVLAGTLAVIAVQSRANRTLRNKNAELANTNKLLDQQRSRAEQREQQAIDAVKRFRDAVEGEEELKNNAELEQLRKRLLKEPLAFFKVLTEQLQTDDDTRPEALARLARAALQLGILTSEIGDKRDALRTLEEARVIGKRLVRENPSVSVFASDLAVLQNRAGELLLGSGKPAEALAAFEEARMILGGLVQENPAANEFLRELAESHRNIARVLLETGRCTEALAAHEQARIYCERLVQQNSNDLECQARLADSHHMTGRILAQTGEPIGALAAFERARAIYERLVVVDPGHTHFRRELAKTQNGIGINLDKIGKSAEALAALERARAIFERLAQDSPSVIDFQTCVAESLLNIGEVHRKAGKPADALGTWERALAIFERLVSHSPTTLGFRAARLPATTTSAFYSSKPARQSRRWSPTSGRGRSSSVWRGKVPPLLSSRSAWREVLKTLAGRCAKPESTPRR